MTIKTRGKFLPKDADGYIINDTSADKIAQEFRALIIEVQNIIITELGEALHSLYLTGSIPRGMAAIGSSDLDIFATLKPGYTDEFLSAIKEKANALISNNQMVSKIDIEIWTFAEVFPLASDLTNIKIKNTLSTFDVILKNASLCIYGKDLGNYIPPIKPDVALANDELIVIHDDIQEAKRSILAAKHTEQIEYWCKRVMKNIIRAGFCLCIPIIHQQTRDIDLCAEVFLKHYPGMQGVIERALTWIQKPSSSASDIIQYLDDSGASFLSEVDHWMERYNPERLQELPRNPP